MTPAPDGRRDAIGGSILLLVGLGAAGIGRTYPMGTLARMGPGFYPVALGVILALIGLAIILSARRRLGTQAEGARPQWRAWLLIALSIVAFVELGARAGLVAATLAIVFIAALADRDNSYRDAALLALAMLVVCLAVFWWALGIPFPLFPWSEA